MSAVRKPLDPPSFLRFCRAIAGLPAGALPSLAIVLASASGGGCAMEAHAQGVDERYNGGGALDRRCPRRQPRVHAFCPITSARAQVSCHYGTSRPSSLCNCVATRDGPRWNCRSIVPPMRGPLPPPDLSDA